jgi:hypothetical protein
VLQHSFYVAVKPATAIHVYFYLLPTISKPATAIHVYFYLLPTISMGQKIQSLRVHEQQLNELVVFLTTVTFLDMEQQINTKF